jgi:hypothetical protein
MVERKIDESTMQRLAFIKYVYGVAVEQSQQPEPLAGASILTLHDGVELFLQLATEYLDAPRNSKQTSLMDYWNVLNKKLPEPGLAQKESMRRLNSARVSLKHHGTLPSITAIESFRSSVTNFFEDNTPMVFNIDFTAISMINLVGNEVVKGKLARAERLMDSGDTADALIEIAKAFERLLYDYRRSTGMGFRELRSFSFYHVPSNRVSAEMSLGRVRTEMKEVKTEKLRNVLGRSLELLRDLHKSVVDIQRAMNVIVLGLDYRRYAKFKQVTPSVTLMADNQTEHIMWMPPGSEEAVTLDDCTFCMNYVIDCAIRLQDVSFRDKRGPMLIGSRDPA